MIIAVLSKSPSSIACQAVNIIWFHIIFGQVFFRMVGFPAIIYPRGPSQISFNLGMCVRVVLSRHCHRAIHKLMQLPAIPTAFSPTWIGWFQWKYGWIEDNTSGTDKELMDDDEEKNSSG